MKTKNTKRILFFSGFFIILAGTILVLINHTLFLNIFIFYLFLLVGFIPVGLSMIMHSKEHRGEKKASIVIITILGYFWFVCAVVSLAIIILVFVFMGDIFISNLMKDAGGILHFFKI